MYDYPFTNHGPCADAQVDINGVQSLLCSHYDALLNGASLLSGHRGRRLVEQIRESVVLESRLTQRLIEKLFELLGILTLQNVHNEDLPEAGYFASIDPSDPVVEEICLLADRLRQALAVAGPDNMPCIDD